MAGIVHLWVVLGLWIGVISGLTGISSGGIIGAALRMSSEIFLDGSDERSI